MDWSIPSLSSCCNIPATTKVELCAQINVLSKLVWARMGEFSNVFFKISKATCTLVVHLNLWDLLMGLLLKRNSVWIFYNKPPYLKKSVHFFNHVWCQKIMYYVFSDGLIPYSWSWCHKNLISGWITIHFSGFNVIPNSCLSLSNIWDISFVSMQKSPIKLAICKFDIWYKI